ncbi:hypothetical protein K1719_039590 [Acacia pycnantha]|nr:hypothetical protein K1719_039590 [Acacia pycnantha]
MSAITTYGYGTLTSTAADQPNSTSASSGLSFGSRPNVATLHPWRDLLDFSAFSRPYSYADAMFDHCGCAHVNSCGAECIDLSHRNRRRRRLLSAVGSQPLRTTYTHI